MKFDLDKIKLDPPGPEFQVKYAVYNEETAFDAKQTYEDVKERIKSGLITGTTTDSSACFASLKNVLSEDSNRLLFKVDFKQGYVKELHLTNEEIKKWTNLCKYHGLMPPYIGNHFTDTGNFVLNIEGMSLTKMYLILVIARYPQERPELARAAIYFRSLGLNFFLAFLVATRCTSSTTGHSIFSQGQKYPHGEENDPNKSATVAPWEALALKKYIEQSRKGDKVPFSQLLKSPLDRYKMKFNLQGTINKFQSKIEWGKNQVKITELFSKEVQSKFK